MSDIDDAMRVLADVVPIGLDHPQVQQFADAVVADIAARTDAPARPSPSSHPSLGDRIDRLEASVDAIRATLDEVLSTLRGGGDG